MKKPSNLPTRLVPYFVMQFACNAIYQNNITNYLKSISMTDQVIGSLMALIPLIGMVGQFIFGRLGDRMRYKNTLLIALSVLSAGIMLLFGQTHALPLLGILLCTYSFFQMSAEPLMTTIALETLDRTGSSFGPIRSVGTISFALVSPIVGLLIDNQYGRMIYMLCAGLLLCAASGFLLPKVEGHAHQVRSTSVGLLLKNRHLVVMLLFTFCLMISMSLFYTFFPIYLTSTTIGGTSAMLGWGFFISASSEIPFLIFSDRLLKKMGVGIMLMIAAAAIVLRMTSIYFLVNPYALLATQVFHSWGFVVMTFAMSKYIYLVVPPELRASGQMLFTLFAITFGRSIGSFIGGMISSQIGIRNVFLVAGAVSLVSLVVFGSMILKDKSLRMAGRESLVKQY